MEDKQTREKYRNAIEKRDRFLEAHPELRQFQQEIDRYLEAAGGVQNRMSVLGFMIHDHLLQLERALLDLQSTVVRRCFSWQAYDRRSGHDKRVISDRRHVDDPYWSGPERRGGVDRRSGIDRRRSPKEHPTSCESIV
jgi:hypothetical protein